MGAELWQDSGHDHDDVKKAIESLPDPYRTILELRHYARKTFEEIAQEVGMKDRRFSWQYHKRALRRLADVLELPT